MAPPIPRPPEPPVEDPGPRSLGCYEGYGSRDLGGFLMAVRDVIRFEWDRQRGAPPKDVAQQEVFLSQVISAIQVGHVIPGFTRDVQTGKCFMDWAELACWARWYAVIPDEVGRSFVLDELARGNIYPWSEIREYDWPSAFTECDPDVPSDQQTGCCPATVWSDTRYAVGTGRYPGDQPSSESDKSNVGVIVAVGLAAIIGVTALVLTSRSQA